LLEEPLDACIAAGALAGLGVHLEDRVPGELLLDLPQGRRGQDRAPQARVEDDAGGVDGPAVVRADGLADALLRLREDRRADEVRARAAAGPARDVAARVLHRAADGIDHDASRHAGGHALDLVALEQGLDRRDVAEQCLVA
jgi:hypothetical protein